MKILKYVIFLVSFLSLSFSSGVSLASNSCDVALVDWSSEYHCISELNFESNFRRIPFHGPSTENYASTISRIKGVIRRLPQRCQNELPEEYTYGPLLALSKYKAGALLITSLGDIEGKVRSYVRASGCQNIPTLSLVGHGSEGSISLGSGVEYDDDGEISNENINLWWSIFRKLSGRVGRVQLVGCKTGKGAEGAKLVKSLSRVLSCEVTAPTKSVSSSQNIFHLSRRERTTFP